MRQTRKAFCVGVEQQHGKGNGREPKSESIELRGGKDKDSAGGDDESGDEGGGEIAGRKSAGAGAGIRRVDSRVGEAVEGHGGGARSDHGDDDPEKLMRGGKSRGGEHSSAESERESENGVLPLDHLECDPEVVEDGHGEIVNGVGSEGFVSGRPDF